MSSYQGVLRKSELALAVSGIIHLQGSLRITNEHKPKSSWYQIKARSGVAEIQLYDDIGMWGITARQFSDDLKALGDLSLIKLRVHSGGGDVFDGIAIYNLLKNHPARVEAWVDGLAASMASVVLMSADVIHIPANAMIMVHKPWGIQGGNADEMRRYADLLDKVEKSLTMAYVHKTGKTETEIEDLLTAETWMNGAEAVEAGFADQLTEPLEAAASLNTNRLKEYNMPNALKALMQPRGSVPAPAKPNPAPATPAADPTPTPAASTPAPAAPAAPTTAPSASFQQTEVARREAVKAAFTGFTDTHGELLNACLLDFNVTAEQAKDLLLAKLGAGTTPTARPDAGAFADNGNIVGDSVKNSISARIGLEKAEKDNRFVGMTLAELARASLTERGVSVQGVDRLGMVGMAFTHSTSDFGHLLSDVANKSMLKGYSEAEETFQKWTNRGVLSDFKPASRVDLATFPSLDKVPEGAEYKHGSVGDRGEKIMLATYGKLFSITRQTIINDDLNALSRIPMLMGRAAIRTVGDLVYAILKDNPDMGDGEALFHKTKHKNLLDAAALSIARIDAAKTAMMTQKEGASVLNIRPAFMLTPVAMESTAKALLQAEYDPSNVDARIPNPVRNIMEVIADARLDGQSAVNTYMVANPAQFDTIEVAYLDGNDTPFIEQQQGFTVDGAMFKVRMDAGVAPLSYRTMLKLQGA